jgi:hypothetical protein
VASGLAVTVGGVSITPVVVNSTTLTGTMPAHADGLVDIYVATDNGNDTLANAFTYAATDEPADPGSGYLWADNFDGYASTQAMIDAASPKTEPNNGDGHPPAWCSLITGFSGAGKALRAIVNGGGGEEDCAWLSPWSTPLTSYDPAVYAFVVSIRFRGTGSIGNSGTKWFEMWDTGSLRLQFSIQNNRWCVASGNYGSGSGWPTLPGRQPAGAGVLYPNDYLDGDIHTCVMYLATNTTATDNGSSVAYGSVVESSRDGRAAMWIDGTKIVEVSQAVVDVTPSGCDKAWCTQTDVDTIPSLKRTVFKFPDVFNATPSALTLDHDDLKVWLVAR